MLNHLHGRSRLEEKHHVSIVTRFIVTNNEQQVTTSRLPLLLECRKIIALTFSYLSWKWEERGTTAVTVMTLLVEVRDRDISNRSQRERNLSQKLKVTVLATSRQVPKFTAWKSAIVLRIVKNASEQIWPVVIVAIVVIAFLQVRPKLIYM